MRHERREKNTDTWQTRYSDDVSKKTRLFLEENWSIPVSSIMRIKHRANFFFPKVQPQRQEEVPQIWITLSQ